MPNRSVQSQTAQAAQPAARNWSSIGINAVAAASIYCDHRDGRRDDGSRRPVRKFDGPDYATD